MAEKEAAISPGEAFAERMRQVRNHRGMTQEQLSRRLDEIGYPIQREVLTKIERGAARGRNIKLEEAFAICVALDVSPAHMFAPYDVGKRVSIVPALPPRPAALLRGWIAGRWPLAGDAFAWFAELPREELVELDRRARRGRPLTTAEQLEEVLAERQPFEEEEGS